MRRAVLASLRLALAGFVLAGTASLAAIVLGALGVAAGARVVVTDSIPRGLYRIVAQAPVRGSVAGGCLPPEIAADVARRGYGLRGGCAGGILPFVKIVAAVAGDTVVEDAAGVTIDGVRWPWSAPRHGDRTGRPLPARFGAFVVPAGDVLLLGLNPDSYDGRYFGPTPRDRLATYRPVLIEATPYARELRRIADRGTGRGSV